MSRTREHDICVQAARECARLAEATSDPEMRSELFKLALDWMAAAVDDEQEHPIGIEEALVT
jgi:hypothetical protein